MIENIADKFKRSNFACPCCGIAIIDTELLSMLVLIREEIGIPIIINSGYRCPKHNADVDGSLNSYHMRGQAADIRFFSFKENLGIDKIMELTERIYNIIDNLVGDMYGMELHDTFIHFDIRAYRYRKDVRG